MKALEKYSFLKLSDFFQTILSDHFTYKSCSLRWHLGIRLSLMFYSFLINFKSFFPTLSHSIQASSLTVAFWKILPVEAALLSVSCFLHFFRYGCWYECCNVAHWWYCLVLIWRPQWRHTPLLMASCFGAGKIIMMPEARLKWEQSAEEMNF